MAFKGVCVLEGSSNVSGTVYFEKAVSGKRQLFLCCCAYHIFFQDGGKTRVTGKITGLKPGKHGFHIHQFGDYSGGCVSAGSHFNPHKKQHGGPTDDNRHAGDLGNVIANDAGEVTLDIVDGQIPLEGENSIIGRSVVV